ncbi:hypothetical protein EIK77_000510 [Talaromyces pinophilus]|nr:hypothetical protein EIK77_000510 [Talaromyces pinophilus]
MHQISGGILLKLLSLQQRRKLNFLRSVGARPTDDALKGQHQEDGLKPFLQRGGEEEDMNRVWNCILGETERSADAYD